MLEKREKTVRRSPGGAYPPKHEARQRIHRSAERDGGTWPAVARSAKADAGCRQSLAGKKQIPNPKNPVQGNGYKTEPIQLRHSASAAVTASGLVDWGVRRAWTDASA